MNESDSFTPTMMMRRRSELSLKSAKHSLWATFSILCIVAATANDRFVAEVNVAHSEIFICAIARLEDAVIVAELLR